MAYRASTKTADNTSASVTVNKPTGTVENDIILIWYNHGGGHAGTLNHAALGFTELVNADIATPGNTVRLLWKRCGAAEPSSWAITSNISDIVTVIAASWSGRSTVLAPTAVLTQETNVQTSPITATLTGYTAAAADDVAWCLAQCGGGATGFTATYTPPTDYTEAQDSQGSGYVSNTVAYRDNVSAGATGNLAGTMTFTGTSCRWSGVVVKLPAPAVATPVSVMMAQYRMRK